MQFNTRILADRLIATPVAMVFNLIARVLGFVMHRDHSVTSTTSKQIVIAKLVGMGSAIQASPLIQALRQRFPEARITFVTLKSNRALVERIQGVDQVLCLDDRNLMVMARSTARVIVELMRIRVDHYFDLEVYSGFASLLALWSMARNRLGFYRHSSSFKRGLFTHLVYFNTRMPVRRLYMQLGSVLGAVSDAEAVLPALRIEDPERQSARAKLTKAGFDPAAAPFIVVNPNASDLLLERRWPESLMVETIERLTQSGRRIVLIGSPGEADYVGQLWQKVSPQQRPLVHNSAGTINLHELLALLEMASCIITNDTGPMHMAVAIRTPTVALFGPCSPDHYGFHEPNVVMLYAPVLCSPCVHEIDTPPCGGDNICMQRIAVDDVVQATLSLLEPAPGPKPARLISLPLAVADQQGKPLGYLKRASLALTSDRPA